MLLFFSFSACLAHSFSQNPTVSTPQGVVHGVQLSKNVNGFLGIPYAQPPTGKLRFEPPQKITPLPEDCKKNINATAFGLVCFQFHYRTVMGANMLPTTSEGEDCLSLNIFSSSQKQKSKLPVYMWSYGGAFAEGGGSVPMYNPTNFVENHPDILVVTWKYVLVAASAYHMESQF
jgi:carboxylesterase type B